MTQDKEVLTMIDAPRPNVNTKQQKIPFTKTSQAKTRWKRHGAVLYPHPEAELW